MARLIFEKVILSEAGGDTNAVEVKGLITESPAMTEEMLQVAIEDNQNIIEGYTSSMLFRTKDATYNTGASILDATNTGVDHMVYAGGSNSLLKRRMRFVGINGGSNITIDNVYVMGRRVFDNGREEIEVSAQLDATSQQIVVG